MGLGVCLAVHRIYHQSTLSESLNIVYKEDLTDVKEKKKSFEYKQ